MAEIITGTFTPQDPILGARDPVTQSVTVGEWVDDVGTITNALVKLFQKFSLPNGGTIVVQGYGQTIEWEHDGFLVPLARRLAR